jgi:hypothetical protein
VGQQIAGVSSQSGRRADPLTLSLLLSALTAWGAELKDISDLQLSQETTKQLASAGPSFLRGAQLVVQTFLADYVRPRASEGSYGTSAPWTLLSPTDSRTELSLRVHAQVLAALIETERTFMPSPYLRSRIAQLAAGLAQRLEEPKQTTETNSLAESVWLQTALRAALSSGLTSPLQDALLQQAETLQNKIDAFERSVLP